MSICDCPAHLGRPWHSSWCVGRSLAQTGTEYWLCCGSMDRTHVKNCTASVIYHRWGTAEKHSVWQKTIAKSIVPKTLQPVLPTGADERNAIPMCTGVLDYFALALAEIAKLSKVANEQHNPGQPMHWALGKSTDHADKILKHLVDRGLLDTDGMRHSAKVAWRALALLTEELVAAGGKHARNAYKD